MKNRVVNILGYIGVVTILAEVAAVGFLVFKAGFENVSNTSDFITAFSGAFFAFIFVKLAEMGTRLYQRQRINQRALVGIEQTMQEYINRLYGNDFIAKDIQKTIGKAITSPDKTPKVNFNFLKPLPMDTTPSVELRNIEYRNDLLNFYADIEKLNGSMSSVQRFYDLLTSSLMSGQLKSDDYLRNLKVISEKLDELRKFIAASIEDTLDIAAKTRILLHENGVLFITAIQLQPQRYSEGLLKKLPSEVESLQKEMTANTAASQERIQQIVSADLPD